MRFPQKISVQGKALTLNPLHLSNCILIVKETKDFNVNMVVRMRFTFCGESGILNSRC